MAVLPGTSRTVIGFIAAHWVPLIQLSVVPVAIMVAMSLAAGWAISGVFAELMALQLNPDIPLDPGVMRSVLRAEGLSMLMNIVAALAMAWLFVRLIRYYAFGELSWASLGPGGIKPVLLTVLYGIGIAILTFLVYIAGVIVLALVIGLFAGVAGIGDSGSGAVIFAVVAGGAFIGLVAFVLWFQCRFIVALPAVALGTSPDFFKGMWPLSRGESWGVPLRLILGSLVFLLVFLPIAGLAAWPYFAAMIEQARTGMMPDAIQPGDILRRLMLAGLLGFVVQIPWIWFISLLLAEAYRRFIGRPGAPAFR